MTGAFVTSSGEEHRGFHQSPNILRDIYMKKIGVDGYGFLQYLLSWANTKAQLSVRRMKQDLKVSQDKLERIQALVLEHCGHFVALTPGNSTTSNRWHLDMRQVWTENAIHMAKGLAERAEKESVPEIGTPPEKPEKGVPEIGTLRTGNRYRGVPKAGTIKDISLKKQKEGGALHVTGNPRAPEELAAPPVAVLDQPEHTTSEKAAPLTASVAQTADGPLVAGTPDGVTPTGFEVTDEDLKMLFERQDDNVTAVKQVPPAAEAARPAEINDLVAVPEAELLDRPQAAVSGPVYKAIMALVGGAAKLEVYLAEETRSGGYGRERWLRLNLDEVGLVKTTAQAQARQAGPDGKRIPFSTLSILGLDRLIGAPKLTPGSQKAAQPAGPYGNATKLTVPGQKLSAPPAEPATGSSLIDTWQLKTNPLITVQVVQVNMGTATLSDGTTMPTPDLVVKYNRLHVGVS